MRLKNCVITALFSMVIFGTGEAAEDKLSNQVLLAIRPELSALRLEEKDLILPKGQVPAQTIPFVEKLFDSPLAVFSESENLASKVEDANGSLPIFQAASDVLSNSNGYFSGEPTVTSLPALPVATPNFMKPILQGLYMSLTEAKVFLDKSSQSVSKKEQDNFLALLLESDISSRRMKERYDAMKKFDQASLLIAGSIVFRQIDLAVAALKSKKNCPPLRWETDLGTFVVGGAGDDAYSAKDLENVAVLIDLGGRNLYIGPAASAKSGEFRIVIDIGKDVTVRSTSTAAGTGIFGIGAMILPNPEGIKIVSAGSFSEGCGIGGIGALTAVGPLVLNGEKYTQGTGALGIGFLSVRNGAHSRYSAVEAGQGVGLVRGVGIFTHAGEGAEIRGGLVEPDPREPLGAVSLCQGVGFGQRGYSGGGVGVCLLKGDKISVQGSYFAQGAGYWHGLGVFKVKGNQNVMQARRYDLGSGVHYALGHFILEGNGNRVLNWGVGPAYGWDRALGSAVIAGDDNEIQVEWGSGTASIGGLSFSLITGNRNKLQVSGHGSGGFFRDEASYAVHVIRGKENILKDKATFKFPLINVQTMPNPWGVLKLDGVELSSELKLTPPTYPDLPAHAVSSEGGINLPATFKDSLSKNPAERIEDLIDVAGAFSLDKDTPRKALIELLSLSSSELPYVVDNLRPESVDQMIQIRIALAAYGPTVAQLLINRLNSVEPPVKNILLNFLDAAPVSLSIPILMDLVKNSSIPSEQARAALILGRIFNRDAGKEPGLRAALIDIDNKDLLERMYFSDAFGLLARIKPMTKQDRLNFLEAAPKDLTEPLGSGGAKEFIRQISESADKVREIKGKEIRVLTSMEPLVRANIYTLLQSTSARSVAAGIIALGQIGNPEDAVLIPSFFDHPDAVVRDAAANALNRMGEEGISYFKKVFPTSNTLEKQTILASLANASSDRAGEILKMGIVDIDPAVRSTAMSVLAVTPPVLEKYKKELMDFARNATENEKYSSVIWTFRRLP